MSKSHERAKGHVTTTWSAPHPSQGRYRLILGASTDTGEPGACYTNGRTATNGCTATNGRNATKSPMRAKALRRPLGLCTILPRVALYSSGMLPLAQVNQEPVTLSPRVRLWRRNEHIYTEQGLDTCRVELQSITHVKTKTT